MALPANYTRVWVRGTFISLDGTPMKGKCTFAPSPSVLLDYNSRHIIGTKPFDALLANDTGKFAVQLPATNDPDITPVSFTYKVTEPTGRTYNIAVPYDTPVIDDPADPLNGQQVIDLITIVPTPSASSGFVQIIAGPQGVNGATWYVYGGDSGIAQPDPAALNPGDLLLDVGTGEIQRVETEVV